MFGMLGGHRGACRQHEQQNDPGRGGSGRGDDLDQELSAAPSSTSFDPGLGLLEPENRNYIPLALKSAILNINIMIPVH